jgi:hypothetical protein
MPARVHGSRPRASAPAGLGLDARTRAATLDATRECHAPLGIHAWQLSATLPRPTDLPFNLPVLHFGFETAQGIRHMLSPLNLALAICAVLVATPAYSQGTSTTAISIGVVSLVGHDVSFLRIGFTVFQNQYASTKTAATQIADAIADTVIEDLRLEPTFKVKRIPVSQSDLSSWGEAALASSRGLFPSPLENIQSAVAQLASSCSCDDLLFITDYVRHEVRGTNQHARGLTFLYSSPEESTVLAPILMTRFNVATQKVTTNGIFGFEVKSVPYRWPEGKEKLLPQPTEELVLAASAIAAQRMQPAATARTGLRRSLFRIGLRPSCALLNYEKWRIGLPPTISGEPDVAPPVLAAGADPSTCT